MEPRFTQNNENTLKEVQLKVREEGGLDALKLLFNPGQSRSCGSGEELLQAHGDGR